MEQRLKSSNFSGRVSSAAEMTSGVIERARTAQLAAATYLFEVAGLHSLMEETAGNPEERFFGAESFGSGWGY